jgi:hypothetical protein
MEKGFTGPLAVSQRLRNTGVEDSNKHIIEEIVRQVAYENSTMMCMCSNNNTKKKDTVSALW